MNKKYSEWVEIIGMEDFDVQEITANVIIKVKERELFCFVSDFKERGPFSMGEKCAVALSLMTWPKSLNKIKEKNKGIKSGNRYKTHCALSGEIVAFNPIVGSYYNVKEDVYYTEENTDYKAGIVDCDIFVAVEIPKDSDLKVGDYIKAEGRLDIKKVKD